jgi:RNA polymerase sigma-70 factor (ECF subfamily)
MKWRNYIVTKEKLGEVILASERQMYATAKSILQRDTDCADAIQEAIVKAFSGIDQLRRDKYAKTWLMRILINECYNLCRQNSRIISFEEYEKVGEMEAPERKDYSELYSALRHLTEELRTTVILYYMEQFSVKEVAAILDISEGAVQKRLARARKQMKTELQEMEVEFI